MGKPNDDLNNMMCLDFVGNISAKTYQKFAHKVKQHSIFPLVSWDLSGNHLGNIAKRQDADRLHKFSKQFGWRIEIDKLLMQHYEALVLTDANQLIVWTNEGFSEMTGYDAGDAIGRNPNFLQGGNTSAEMRRKIKAQLFNNTPFTEVIVNYKKDSSQYLCEIKIFPIHNQQNEITHFIALESAV